MMKKTSISLLFMLTALVAWASAEPEKVIVGHGDTVFTDATQNLLTLNALRYVVSLDPKGDPFMK